MKHLTLSLTLLAACTFVALPTSSSAQQEKQLSIWERIFGTSERPTQESTNQKAKKAEVQDTEEEEEQEEKTEKVKSKEKKQKAEFSEEEREVLENWQKGSTQSKQGKKKKKLPPGLQKKLARGGELPPGWKKKLEVGSVLDPELEEQAEPLPQKILDRLPKTPEGTSIIKIGDEVVRVFENSREIIDILSGKGGQEPQQDND